MGQPQKPRPVRALDDPPGGVLFWMIVGLELLTFAMLFGYVAHLRASDPAAFAVGQATLHLPTGLAMTLVLVTSGAMAAQAVHHFRAGAPVASRRWFLAAAAVGVVFVVLKVVTVMDHLEHGLRLGTSDFQDAWWLGTGFHFLHVLVGLFLLVGVAARVDRATFNDDESAIAGSALFWHMCDVAWFFLFPLFFAR